MRQQYGHGLLRSAGVLFVARLFDLTTVLAILLGSPALVIATPAGQVAFAVAALLLGLAPFALAGLGTALLIRLGPRLTRRRQGPSPIDAKAPAVRGLPAGLWRL